MELRYGPIRPFLRCLTRLGQIIPIPRLSPASTRGWTKTYAYSDRILYTYPDGDADRLLELYCTADVQTAQGVGIGASRKDVEAAYGTEYTQAGSTMTYALAAQDSLTIPASLYFELDGDTVCAIGLTSAHRAE